MLKNALVGLGVGAATYFGGRAVLDLLKNRMKVGLFKEFRKQNRGITERQVFADLKAVSQEFRTAVLAEDMLKAPTPILAKYGPGDLLKAKQILLAEAERLKAIIRQNREVGGPNKDRLRDIELLALSTQTEYSRRYGPNTEVEFGHWLTEEEYLALEQEYGAK